jgi:hypothetical protein
MSRCMFWRLYSWERVPDTHWLEGLFEIKNLKELNRTNGIDISGYSFW